MAILDLEEGKEAPILSFFRFILSLWWGTRDFHFSASPLGLVIVVVSLAT